MTYIWKTFSYHAAGTEWHIVKCDFCGSYGAHVGCHDDLDSKDSFLCCPLDWKIHGGTKQHVFQAAKKIGIFSSDQPETPSNDMEVCNEEPSYMKSIENISSPLKIKVNKTKVHSMRRKRAKTKPIEISNGKKIKTKRRPRNLRRLKTVSYA